jgi:zinc transport system permease protein
VIISEDLAITYNININLIKAIFLILIAVFVAVAIKIIGVLLVTAIMIIPSAAARKLSTSPEQMVVKSAIIGAIAVVAGVYASVIADTPTTPTIVCTNLLMLFFIGLVRKI